MKRLFHGLAITAALAGLVANAQAESDPVTAAAAGPLIVEPDGVPGPNIAFWLESSLQRVFPKSSPGDHRTLELVAGRNYRLSFQTCVQNRREHLLTVECEVSGAPDLKTQVRRVGYVPMRRHTADTAQSELDGVGHVPGFVPDPLFPIEPTWVGPWESQAFWVSVYVPADVEPGKRVLTIKFWFHDRTQQAELKATIDVRPLVVQPRKDFPVIHWWRGEATWDFYKTGMFDERWWLLTRGQLENMLAHGSDVVYVPIFFNRRETFKRPCQLLIVNEPEPGKYEFDWSRVKRFTDMAREIGFNQFEWSHLWIYWGVENPIRVYTQKGDDHVMLWPPDTQATSNTYVNFLKQFLPQFHDFLKREKILDASYFHLSDEPGSDQHVENYRKARKVLRDLAPWMKVMDALSDIRYGREGLTDIPIPVVNAAQAYIDEKIPHWVYYCCGPTGPWINRFFDTPLAKIRMNGFLFYRLGAKGFLHWGFNYWHKLEQEELVDPFTDGSGAQWPNIPYGDPFVVYPGPDGPLDSIRWEVFAESLQDYALLQTAGIKPDDPLLKEIKTYADFPKSKAWVEETLRKILAK